MKSWFKNLFKKKENAVEFHGKKVGGGAILYDDTYKTFVESTLAEPKQTDLNQLAEVTQSVVISKNVREKVSRNVVVVKILEIHNPDVIKTLFTSLGIMEPSRYHIFAGGQYLIDCIQTNGNVHRFEYVDFTAIRCKTLWKYDGKLKNPLAPMHWLHGVGISEPMNQWLEYNNETNTAKRRYESWKSCALPPLADFLDDYVKNPEDFDVAKVFNSIKKFVPDEFEVVLRLFGLYGLFSDNWNNAQMYEKLTAEVLMIIDFQSLNKAFCTQPLTTNQKEGMARFLCDWNFHQKRKSDLTEVTLDVKNMLLEHLLAQGDEEKIETFKRLVLGCV